jgi:hypothetical protein
LFKSVWCPGTFLHLNRQYFFEIWEIFCYYFIEYITYPLACTSSPPSMPDSQVWPFDGVTEFLHIPFTALELFD